MTAAKIPASQLVHYRSFDGKMISAFVWVPFMLILQGDNDIRVPKEEAEQVVKTLKGEGKTVEAHYYSNEGHGFSKRENQVDAMDRMLDFFDRYLKGGDPGRAGMRIRFSDSSCSLAVERSDWATKSWAHRVFRPCTVMGQ